MESPNSTMATINSGMGSGSGSCSTATNDDLQSSGSESNLGFAFNDSKFSDRILKVEILPNLPDAESDGDGCRRAADWENNRKCRRDDVKFESGDETLQINFASLSMDCSAVLQVRTIHISSSILAAKSPFFDKLFSNGMRESEQQSVTLRIHDFEEDALMDLLKFMYCNTLQTKTPGGLLNVLMIADKYDVESCMKYCTRMLQNFPMNSELASLYLDLPSNILMPDAVKPLIDAAKEFLVLQFKDITKFQEEMMSLPLAGIEAVLASDDLQVDSEDAVYDFAVKWARTHYLKLEDRRKVLGTRLCPLIRFAHMTGRNLREVMTCNDLDRELSSKLVTDALFFKVKPPYRQRALLADETNASNHRFVERAYKYRPVKVIEFEIPRPQSVVVYWDLKKEECQNLFPSGQVYSKLFHLGDQGIFLLARCKMDQQSHIHYFGLFLGMQEKGSVPLVVDCEFFVREKPTNEFVWKHQGNFSLMNGKSVGYKNFFGKTWTSFMAGNSKFFIDGVLHLKAELIRQTPNV